MKSATREWVRRAQEDHDVATALMRRRSRTAADSIGFHAQQWVEKYSKARLEEAGLKVLQTHDLAALLQLLLPIEPLWASFAPSLRRLNNYAVKFRYPGHVASRLDARAALRACRAVRADVRLSRDSRRSASRFKPSRRAATRRRACRSAVGPEGFSA